MWRRDWWKPKGKKRRKKIKKSLLIVVLYIAIELMQLMFVFFREIEILIDFLKRECYLAYVKIILITRMYLPSKITKIWHVLTVAAFQNYKSRARALRSYGIELQNNTIYRRCRLTVNKSESYFENNNYTHIS